MLKWPMKKWGMALEGAADPDVPAPRPSKKKNASSWWLAAAP